MFILCFPLMLWKVKKKITVSNAQELVSAVESADSGEDGDVEIILSDGTYYLTSPLTVSNNTNRITIKAAKDATPVISGNVNISGSSFNKVPGKNYYSYTIPGAPKFRDLYLNGKLLKLARSGNYTFQRNNDGNCFFVNNAVSELVGDAGSLEICLDIEWMQKHYRVDSITSGSDYDRLSIKPEDWYAYTYYDGNKYNFTGRTYHFENHLSLLDEPGEFYYDGTTGTVYFYPFSDTDMANAVISYPATEKLFDLHNSSNITIDGLSFTGVTSNFTSEHGFNGGQGGSHDWLDSVEAQKGDSAFFYGKENTLAGFDSLQIPSAAIYSFNSSELTVKNCNFYELGSNGINLSGFNYNAAVNNNVFNGLSMSAIVIGNRRDLWTRENGQTFITVNGNCIDGIGREYACCTAIIIGAVKNYSVVHNTVRNTPQTAIGVGIFTDTDGKGINIMNAEIAYNYCDDNMMNSNDGGGIYFCGSNDLIKNRGIYNRIHDNYVTGDSEARTYTGIYLDANCSNTHVYNNVIEGIVTSHQPVFNQDVVPSQYTHNNIVENNYTTGMGISENTIDNKYDPKADYGYRNVIVRNNTFSDTLGSAAIGIKNNAGSKLA